MGPPRPQARAAETVLGGRVSSIRAIKEAIAAALDDVMGPAALGEDAIQVVSRVNFEPQAPTSVDIIDGDYGGTARDPESAGFGDIDGAYIFTIRARVTTPDSDAAQDQLEALRDDEHELCLAAALEADPTLGGVVGQLAVDNPVALRVFDDPPGAMLGCSWRVRVINATS